ncbi:Asp/Glu/hydantoin racemase [Sphingomonas sp. PP-CE-1A-559]|nr:Asp/Glu/hydantoin racemase [Sphingomonas sp. PP-CE-1A-559]
MRASEIVSARQHPPAASRGRSILREIEDLQHKGDWQGLTTRMVDAAQRLEAGGADVLLICTNTMHRMVADVQAALGVPLLHIADPTAGRIKAAGLKKVGLLCTAFTMEHAFYKGRLTDKHGLNVRHSWFQPILEM